MIRPSLCVLFAIALLPGCGSSEESTTPAPNPFASSGANQTFGDRNTACERVINAVTSKASALGCNLVGAKCPDYVDDLERRAGAAGKCVEYDLGTVDNCTQRVATYASCTDFQNKPCEFSVRVVPGTCGAPADAGADAPSEAATDASDDTSAADAAEGG